MGRSAQGVKAIQLDEGDEIVSMVLPKEDEELFVVTSGGYGKRTSVKNYPLQKRGGKGILTYARGKFGKTGTLVGAMIVNENDEIMLINSDDIIIRIKADEVSKLGRTTQGVKIMKVADDANIIAVAKIPEETQDDDLPDDGGEGTQMTLGV